MDIVVPRPTVTTAGTPMATDSIGLKYNVL